MADISKDELRKEITAILKDADLKSMSSKKVRQQLEEKLDCEFTERKKEIDDLVMEYLSEKDGKESEDGEEEEEEGSEEEEEEEEKKEKKKPAKREAPKKAPKRKKGSSDDEESASDDDASDEEYSPKKAKSSPKKGKAGKKGKKGKGGDSDSDSDWGKGKKSGGGGGAKKAAGGGRKAGGGYTRQLTLSPELAAVVGAKQMARHEVVKKMWSIIKEKNLYDPKNKQFAICDDDLLKVFGVKRFRTFGMLKYLKNHFLD